MLTDPGTVRVIPDDLTGLANLMVKEAEAIRTAVYEDPVMLSDAQLYEEYFGPAKEVAARYTAISHSFLNYITTAMSQLTRDAATFRAAAAAFAEADQQNSNAIRSRTGNR
jgi:hypothetical protein